MRVLTVRQPWAWAIIHGGKDVENRVRSLGPHLGLVAIHAGLDIDFDAERDDTLREAWREARMPTWEISGQPLFREHRGERAWLPRGVVIGVVNLTGTHRGPNTYRDRMRAVRSCYMPGKPFGPCSPWAMPDHHHLVLEDPRPLARPIPAKGRLGLWRPDAALEAAIRDQLDGGA